MYVKIELAKNLDKSINSYIDYKKLPKLCSKDIFEKWSRNLNTELNTIFIMFRTFRKIDIFCQNFEMLTTLL